MVVGPQHKIERKHHGFSSAGLPRQVPLHSVPECVRESVMGLKPELTFKFAAVDQVAAIVAPRSRNVAR